MDCYGDPKIIGKIGTDIREGKCTWLIVQALKSPNLSAEISKELRSNYGKKEAEAESKVKDIYHRLNLVQRFQKVESVMEGRIRADICSLQATHGLLAQVLHSFALRIYGRNK